MNMIKKKKKKEKDWKRLKEKMMAYSQLYKTK